MPTPDRPSLTKKSTRSSRENEDSYLDTGVEFFIDGKHYKITVGDLSALDARELRRQVGLTFHQILREVFSDDGDLDMIAAVIWLARYVNGDERDLTYAEVAGDLGYDVLEKIREGAAAERKRVAAEVKAAKKAPAKKAAAVKDEDGSDPES